VHFPRTALAWDLKVETEIPKAVVALYWPTADARDVRRTRTLAILSRILEDRLRVKIREEMGDAYSPEAASEASDTFRDYGQMIAECVVAPDRARQIGDSIRGIAADLSSKGVTPDELERARAPLLTELRESARTNPYWLGAVLGNCQEFPHRLDWARTRMTDVQSISKADVDALAKLYLAPARAFQVIVRPEELVKLTSPSPAAR
jgi:zinc protease